MNDGLAAGITVGGRGVVMASPDAARISVGVQVMKSDLAAARAEAARQATAIIAAVTASGIDKADIRTARYTVQVERDFGKSRKSLKISGYRVSNQVSVTVRDLERIGAVLDAAAAAGANDVSGPDFFVDHPEALEDEARRQAIADARRKAEVIADALGATLGSAEAVSESADFVPIPRMRFVAALEAPLESTPIESGTQEIAVSVQVRWGLARG